MKRVFGHVVAGWRGSNPYSRSRMEMVFGLSAGIIVAIFAHENRPLLFSGLIFAAFTAGLYFWAFVRALQLDGAKADRAYDKRDKFKLSKEYWGSESATAARKRKRG